MNRKTETRLIAGTLSLGVFLTVVAIIAAALWLTLYALGDEGGSDGARAVFYVTTSTWALNFVTLVVLLALARLSDARSAESRSRNELLDQADAD